MVIVEPPTGDPLRRWSASGADTTATDGALFRFLAASKRSVLGAPGDLAVGGLIAGADLVVESLPPGSVEAAGLLAEPGLVVLSISPYGRGGGWEHRPATEFTVQAECGSIGSRGRPDGPPLQAGGRIGEWAAGAFGAAAALAAVQHARDTGRGTHLDVAMAEVMCICTNLFIDLMVGLLGRPPLPQPGRTVEFPSVERAADGWVAFNTNSAQSFQDFLVLVGRTDLADDPTVRHDPVRRADLEASVSAWVGGRTVEEVVELASLLRVPVAPVGNGRTLLDNEQLVARDFFAVSADGTFRHPRPPYLLGGRRPPGPAAAPAPGAHTGRVPPRSRPALARGSAVAAAAADPLPAAGPLPMAGLKVLDMTCWWAGPGATQLFAALGADVIHVEAIQRIDGMRPAATLAFADRDRWWEYSSFFLNINVNKRGITLNLDDPRGVELALELVRWADVVVENYTPRVMEAFGIDWSAVHAANPRAVMVRMPAYGLDGPWRDHVGFAQTMEAMCGMAWVTGLPDGAPTIPRGPGDPLGAAHAAFAIQVALAARDATGEGQLVEASLIESGLNAAAEQVIEYTAYGTVLERLGNRAPGIAPQGVYRCRGDERWLALSVATDEQWAALCRVVGQPGWAADPKLATWQGRWADHDALDAGLADWAAGLELEAAVERLIAAGVPAAPVVDHRSVSSHPELNARRFFEMCPHPVAGTHPMFGMPFRWSGIDRWIRSPAPTLGEHNAEVLGSVLGLDAATIDELAAAGVIGDRPVGVD